MPIGLIYDEVKALDPCKDDFHRVVKLLGGKDGWNGHKIDAAAAREAGCTFDDIVWVASALACEDTNVERRLRLWKADCAGHVLHLYERTGKSEAPRNAIIAARQFARGEIGEDELTSACAAAGATAWEAACGVACGAAWAAAWTAWGSAQNAAGYAQNAAGSACDAEQNWQFDRLIAWLSDDEPEDWPLPELQSRR
ncbi:hypothetical protein GN330_22860 [Nitratireductor sp. CAU 1489]|uniref:Imm-5-like domain-containing protein n=1 Tax=Nitratireductor arenosus TaxID=2682096 RepID=A0A844QQ47_9HYPH|nr:hypothetical protein [Nitratireductor arenosus]MVB00091.1 hypothetical protein [Nitratireductor arenosus]